MPTVKVEFPKVIVVEQLSEQGRANLASNEKLVQSIVDLASNGIVTKDGKWGLNPGGWEIEKLGEGSYKVIHNWGYSNVCLSVNLLQTPGITAIKESTPTYFVVETLLDNKPADAPWSFTLTKVISP